ncbi:rRNA maturation RNase YbeY [Aestuariibacter sp. AA17]|uniref:Endoribonuclease YbeY n=1 Tax=Fluctibacter corallii TaxID=2984329 RepID=A0ABT3AB98_9ALTE|nr:rRNA maturation RNase YbeY [Aestuariibacter sp. AA17]MCV2885941.1 rRNA maturation RNase YbeY [Aestuariibacter sp. AA17]
MNIIVDLQLATEHANTPSLAQLETWIAAALQGAKASSDSDWEVTVRIVSDEESQSLNHEYRGKDAPTNVLSFPFEAPPGIDLPLLGDLVVCANVVDTEAKQQNKASMHHWAHMIVHGTLHLLGFDHIEDAEAEEMESLEIDILSQLGIDDPYQDH